MDILFLSQVVPYPIDAGPKVRSYHVLRYLAAAGHRITLVTFCRQTDRPDDIRHLRQYCSAVHTVPIYRSRVKDAWHLLLSLIQGQPFLIGRDWSPAMAELVRDLNTGTFDVVHADQLWMAPYALLTQSHATNAPTLVLDAHNAVFQIPQRMSATSHNPIVRLMLDLETRKLARYEAATCRRFDRVVTVTQEDQSTLDNLMAPESLLASGESKKNHHPEMTTIPICIDPVAKAAIPRSVDSHRVTFLGGLHWPPNAEGILWFAREVWPRVIQQVPEAVLTVIGKSPPSELVRVASTSTSYDITGYVPDPTPYLSETAAFIVPLHAGGGMRVKIVDAWSWGLPIVSTRIGSEGLEYQDKINLLIADTAADFSQSVVRLLTDPELAARLSAAGRRTAEERYDWRKVYPAWANVYAREEGMTTHDSQ